MTIRKLEDVNKCYVCGSTDLMPKMGVEIEDIMTGEYVRRDILFCVDCETMHYMDMGTLSFEFSYKIGQSLGEKVKKEA